MMPAAVFDRKDRLPAAKPGGRSRRAVSPAPEGAPRPRAPRFRARCLPIAALFLFLFAFPAFGEGTLPVLNASGNRNVPLAADPFEDGEGYSAVLYDNRNGLPTSEANAVAQTGDGFIWIGSYAGLIRYDGNTFESVGFSEGILNTRCLYVDSRARLWIGTNDFGIFLMAGGAPMRVDREDQLLSVSIRAITEDTEGVMYAATAAGVAMIDRDLNLTPLRDARISGKTVYDVRAGAGGLVFGVTLSGDLFVLKGGAVLDYISHEACGFGDFTAILPDPVTPGALSFTVDGSSKVWRGAVENGSLSTDGGRDISPLYGVERLEMINGQLWICAGNGIGRLDANGFRMLENVPMDKLVGHVMTDYEGNLWFTSTRQSVMKIVPNRFLDLFAVCGLSPEIVNSACMLGGRLFVGADSGLFVLEDGKPVDRIPLTEAATASGAPLETDDLIAFLKGTRIRSVIRDSRDRLWISTWGKYGQLRYDAGKLTAFTLADGMVSEHARTVCECADGTILTAQPGGVSVIRGDEVIRRFDARDGLVVTSILTLAEGFGGEMLLGSDGGGIYVVGPDGVGHIGTKDGLRSEVILRLKRSAYRDILWIVTGNSLAYMTPDHRVTTILRFPYSNNYDLYENGRGEVWVLSSNGVYAVSAEELIANGEINAVFYGIPSGLPYVATSNSFSEMTGDGDLFIAGVMGCVRVNIEKPFDDLGWLKVALPYIDIDGERAYPDASGVFTVPHNIRRVTIYPYVLSYSLSDPRIACRLEGFDTADEEISRSELRPLTYTNLRGGAYSFSIRVRDPAGGEGAAFSFPIVKEKALSDTAAASVIMDLASLFLLVGILIYTSMYRKRGRTDDRLFRDMVIVNMILAASELLSYFMETSPSAYLREIMYVENTVFYAALELFPLLFLLYLDFRIYRDKARVRRTRLLYCAPFFLILAVLILNPWTGWIFSITERNAFRSGTADQILFVPILFYFTVSLLRVIRINPRLVLLAFLLILTRMGWDIWVGGISSISFIYTLFLICTHIHVMNRPFLKEAS